MIYGREGNRFFVNSSQGCPIEEADRVFPRESKGDGAVLWTYVTELSGGAPVKGEVAIRMEFQGCGVSRRTAQRLVKVLDPPKAHGLLAYT